jgi:two-component system, response regulator
MPSDSRRCEGHLKSVVRMITVMAFLKDVGHPCFVMSSQDVKQEFGTSVKSWRGRRGISQEELAGRAGLHRTYISDVERGVRNVSLESIEKLARALEIPVETLVSRGNRSFLEEERTSNRIEADELVDILLVEDDSVDEELALQALKRLNITNHIHVVHDGAEAIDFLFCIGQYAARQARKRPQLILLDLYLPKLSGIEVLQRIKLDPRTSSIPVVVLTGSNYDRDVALSRELGSEAYIVKPIDILNLTSVTSRLSLHWALLKPTVIGLPGVSAPPGTVAPQGEDPSHQHAATSNSSS